MFGIVVDLQPAISLLVAPSMIALQLSRLSYTLFSESTIMLDSAVQTINVDYPIFDTELGMVKEVSEVQ